MRQNLFHAGQFYQDVDQMFENLFAANRRRNGMGTARTSPAVNVWEEENRFCAEAELPGVKPEDLEVTVEGTQVTLRGSRGNEQPEGTTFHRRERAAGQFTRVFRLPVELDSSQVQASLVNGVLHLSLPKAQAALPRKVQVQAG